MLMRNVPVFTGDIFSWHRQHHGDRRSVGCIDRSDLSHAQTWAFVEVTWKNDLAIGFVVQSHVTGQEKLFVESRAVRDDEDEITYWVFDAQDGDVSINVFND